MSHVFFAHSMPKRWIRSTAVLLALLFCMSISGSVLNAAGLNRNPAMVKTDTQTDTQTDTEESSGVATSDTVSEPVIPDMNITAQGALVVGTGRGMTLYQSNPDTKVNIPAASKLMCAVIALETLALDTQITISSEVELLDDNDEYSLYLSKGEKCTVEYLVAAILYKDSDAAALSLAEYISIDEPSFVVFMNETAKSLGMNSTLYANTSGDAAYLPSEDSSKAMENITVSLQYTTLSDMSLLFRYALNLQSFSDIFTKYRSLVFLADGTPQIITSTMITAWGLTPKIKGAAKFSCSNSTETSCVLAYAGIEDFAVAILLIGVQNASVYQDLNKVIDTIFSAYEVSYLVVAGDNYRKVSMDGISQPISAVFQNSVRYVHPVGDDYILPDTVFIPSETVALPVRQGELLGQVVFKLEDGTQIATEVVSEVDVWAKTTVLSDTIEMFQANRNLTVIIGMAIVLFLISAIWALSSFLTRKIKMHHPRRLP